MSQEKIHEPWKDVGISGAGRPLRLLYNRPSDRLAVVISEHVELKLYVNRLYYRSVAEASYHPVIVHDRRESHEDALSCETTPFLIYNQMRFRPPTSGLPEYAADWLGLCKLNLATGENEVILDTERLRPSAPYASGWVSSILAVWPDGSGAVCNVGLERAAADGGRVLDYFVYEISFKEGLRRRVAALPYMFL